MEVAPMGAMVKLPRWETKVPDLMKAVRNMVWMTGGHHKVIHQRVQVRRHFPSRVQRHAWEKLGRRSAWGTTPFLRGDEMGFRPKGLGKEM